MAVEIVTRVVDDLTGEELAETDRVRINFAVDGSEYSLDLGPESAQKFRDTIAPFIERAQKITPNAGTRTAQRAKTTGLADVRKWLVENGYEVGERGRIPQELLDNYRKQIPATQ